MNKLSPEVPAQRFQPSEAGLGWLLGQAKSSQCGPSQLLTHPWKPTQCRACSGPSPQAFPGQNPGGCYPAQLLGITALARLVSLLPDPSSKATLWVEAQHEGALPPPCIVRKDPRVPHTARRGA